MSPYSPVRYASSRCLRPARQGRFRRRHLRREGGRELRRPLIIDLRIGAGGSEERGWYAWARVRARITHSPLCSGVVQRRPEPNPRPRS